MKRLFLKFFQLILILFISCDVSADFDNKNNMLVDGKPFFPIGIYSVNPPDAFEELKEAGFNTVHTYENDKGYLQGYLKKAEKHGLKALIFPATQIKLDKFYGLDKAFNAIQRMKDSPALLSWYVVDEPGLQEISTQQVAELYHEIKGADPIHPAALVVAKLDKLEDFAPFTDVMMVDPYPVPDRPLTQVSDTVERAKEAVNDQKPVWAIIQAYGRQS